MKVVKKGQGDPYEAPKHFNYWAMNKLRPELSKRLQVGVSHFLPGGGAEMSSSPAERVYYVLAGSVLVKGKNEEHLLGPDDLIYIAADEEREFQNQETTPATILVIIVQLN